MGEHADTLCESRRPEPTRAGNREVALNWARYVTGPDSGRGVFDAAAVFLAFLESGDNPNTRQSALRHAAVPGRPAAAIVATATEYLDFLDPPAPCARRAPMVGRGDDAGNGVIPAQFHSERP